MCINTVHNYCKIAIKVDKLQAKKIFDGRRSVHVEQEYSNRYSYGVLIYISTCPYVQLGMGVRVSVCT